MSVPELLAPAGSLKVLKTAINTGADAVYLGLSNFSARSSAVNFSHEDAEKGFSYLKQRGKKGYVTINTLIKDNEFNKLKEEIKFLAEIGADGIIVQDWGVAQLIKESAPEMAVHGSTQMTVHNLEGVKLLKNKGIERVVLSRELPISDIEYIKRNTDCELEIFVHGALCVCYSGQCYLSSFIGERSGNRGKCAQPCRLAYSMGDKNGTLLSLKDMESVDYIEKIKKLKIDSLKIEGRLKNEYYTAVVVDSYKKLLSGEKLTKEEKNMLLDIFNRGGYTSYFDGDKKNMFCYNKQEIPYSETEKKAEEKYRELITDESVNPKDKISVDMELNIKIGELPLLLGRTAEKEIAVCGESVTEEALNGVVNIEKIKENLSKTGQTPFKTGGIKINAEEKAFIRISEINALRRKLTDALWDKKICDYKDIPLEMGRREPVKSISFVISVSDYSQYQWAKEKNASFIIAPSEIILNDENPLVDKTVVSIPAVITAKETPIIKEEIEKLKKRGIKYAYAENISHLEFFKGFEMIYSSRMNIINTVAGKFLPDALIYTISKELNLKDAGYVLKGKPVMAEGYGYQSMMLTENCIKKSVNGKCIDSLSYLKDRKNQLFPVVCLRNCRNEILNSVPLVMSDKLSQLKKSGINYLLLSFTVEDAGECENVFSQYEKEENNIKEFTRGHFFRGVQ